MPLTSIKVTTDLAMTTLLSVPPYVRNSTPYVSTPVLKKR